jgi:hypothetical protein
MKPRSDFSRRFSFKVKEEIGFVKAVSSRWNVVKHWSLDLGQKQTFISMRKNVICSENIPVAF